MFENPGQAERCALLRRVKRVAVVGLSPNPARPSHGIARGLQSAGYEVIPVRPGIREVLGCTAFPTLTAIGAPVDLVNVFRSAEHVAPIVDECLALGLPAIWIQEGIVDDAAALRARAGGMTVVMDRCIWRDFRRECG
jgi:predicted CoA-binding protein